MPDGKSAYVCRETVMRRANGNRMCDNVMSDDLSFEEARIILSRSKQKKQGPDVMREPGSSIGGEYPRTQRYKVVGVYQ